MSKYQKIYLDLKTKIEQKEIKAYTYLPSENELMQIYDSSRDTVRKALSLLLNEGYIQKNKGKGSIVLDREKIAFPVSGVMSFKELSHGMSGDIETDVVVFKKEKPSKQIKKELYIQEDDVYHIERVRNIEGERIILDIDYINARIVPDLNEDIAADSLYEYIENELNLKIGFAKKEITVVKANQEEKELLDMKEFDLLVCVTSYSYLEDATLFQYTISKHRPDKFRFVDFARRTIE